MTFSLCVKQKKVTKNVPGSEKYVTTKNGRTMLRSVCADCPSTKTKFVKKQKQGAGILDKPLEAAKIAEQLTRKLIPTTDHVFDRYWSGDLVKNAFVGPNGTTSKKFWTHPKKGTVIKLIKNPKTGKFENVYVEP